MSIPSHTGLFKLFGYMHTYKFEVLNALLTGQVCCLKMATSQNVVKQGWVGRKIRLKNDRVFSRVNNEERYRMPHSPVGNTLGKVT